MAFGSLRDFATLLEDRGALVRIRAQVSAELEITEIANRVCKGPAAANKALLFENVKGRSTPVLINMFGSAERMAWALGVGDLDQLRAKLAALIDLRPPDGLNNAVGRGSALLRALRDAGLKPRRAHRAPVQAVVESRNPTLDDIPILKCWPNDGGRFITLPQVITHDPSRGTRNVGMYRLQQLDDRTLLMHWQRHKGGAEHERVARESTRPQIPAAIVLGGDPAAIWSASAPLPPDIDEYWLAGWLRGRAIPFVDCITQPLQVPANADIVIEGYVDPNRHYPEGPFGDHTGYYTPVGPFPAFHVTAITQREDPIYPATVVGIPPMEDYWMGKATERLFLPLVQLFLPEVIDLAMPAPGLFHNLVVVSIRKRFPGHARKVIHGLWGLALLSLAKALVIVDDWVDVHDAMVAGWQALGNVDWSRDVMIADGPVDQLDHAAPLEAYGGKIGIDATAKLPEEGHPRPWPEVVRMDPAVKARIDALWGELGLT
ncbi:MAG: menaquinone biosynthesis decarboxylase [Anaerolineae bacterium]|nr:menaquinone biosynthesis decarboxylase [Anaerolineae bacterium]